MDRDGRRCGLAFAKRTFEAMQHRKTVDEDCWRHFWLKSVLALILINADEPLMAKN
jgi:hypothetical protein